MIRINLLAVERRSKKAFDLGRSLTLGCSLLLVTSALGIGYWYWSLQKASEALDQEIAGVQQETERLRGVLAQVQLFESRKARLEERVTLIEQLRKGQSGPVHMLDEISRSLPDQMWLTELKQQGVGLTIEGRASSLMALSDFVGNLEGSTYFKRPVEIINSQLEPQTQAQRELIRFSIKAEFAAPGT